MTGVITLTIASTDTGPFDLYSNINGYISAFAVNITRAQLLTGYSTDAIPDFATIIRIMSIGNCNNYIDVPIPTCLLIGTGVITIPPPTTTTTTTLPLTTTTTSSSTSTTTSTTTVIPLTTTTSTSTSTSTTTTTTLPLTTTTTSSSTSTTTSTTTVQPPLPVTGLIWNTTVNNPCNATPWVISNQNLKIRYNITNSVNCGGTCDSLQTGTATATITVGGVDVNMGLSFNGIGELKDPDYEKIVFKLDNVQIADAHAAGGNLGCAMGPVVQTFVTPPPYLLLANSVHTLFIDFTTNDERFHVGAFYEVDLTFT